MKIARLSASDHNSVAKPSRSILLPLTATFLLLLPGCGGSQLVRIATPPETTTAPRIEKIVDLGGLPLAESGPLDPQYSDGVITPGEWLAVIGQGLATPATTVTLGDKPVPIAGYLQNGSILVRAPRGLSARNAHELRVATPNGSATYLAEINHYLAINDISDDRLRFYQTTLSPKQTFLRNEEQIDFRRVRAQAFSPDGSLLYAVQAAGSDSSEASEREYLLLCIHMGGKSRPEIVSQLPLGLARPPVDMALAADGRQLVVLAEEEIVVLDLHTPQQPEVRGTLQLIAPEQRRKQVFRSLALLQQGRSAALLEVLNNEIFLVDLADPDAPHLAWRERISDAPSPSVIDIKADPQDAEHFWLLEGTNLRSIFAEGRQLLKLGKKSEEDKPEEAQVEARLVRCALSETGLIRETPRMLPQAFLPLHMLAEKNGDILVSGVSNDLLKFAEIGLSSDMVLQGIRTLLSTAQLGRIVKTTPEGEVETTAQGMAIFCSLARLPGEETPLYTAMRLAPKVMPPFVKGEWVLEALKLDRVGFRNIRWTTLLPPYLAPKIAVQ